MSDSITDVPAPSLVPQVPIAYGNGFQVAVTNADVALVLQLDNVPQVRVMLSYTTAKTLRDALDKGLHHFESATGHIIMTSDNIATKLSEYNNGE